MRSEFTRVKHLLTDQTDKIKENKEKIKVNKVLPYLVSNVIEVTTTLNTATSTNLNLNLGYKIDESYNGTFCFTFRFWMSTHKNLERRTELMWI